MTNLTSAELGEMADAIAREVAERVSSQMREQGIVIQTLLARIGIDDTHVTKGEAATILTRRRGKPITERMVRGMIERHELPWEQIPGTREYGIPISALAPSWAPVEALKETAKKDRNRG